MAYYYQSGRSERPSLGQLVVQVFGKDSTVEMASLLLLEMRIKMKVTPLKRQGEFWSVTPGKEYIVIGLDHDSYRIVDDIGEPILLPKDGFQVIDETIPDDWVWERYSEDEYYADPPDLRIRGFYEDYFDGKPEARQKFAEVMKKYGIEVNEISPEDKANMIRLYWEQSTGDK